MATKALRKNGPAVNKPASGRTTRPGMYSPFWAGGIETIPRRLDLRNGIYSPLIGTWNQLRQSAIETPLRVLGMLADIDPLVAKSQRNTLTLTCAPNDVRISAVKETFEGAGDDRTDDAGTDQLHQLFETAIPAEVGGLKALRKAFTISALNAGEMCVECVPGPRGTGIAEIWPVDPLTIVFKRKGPGEPAIPFQNQGGIDKELDPEFFLWVPIDAQIGNPYGRPVNAAVLPASLRKMANMQDVSDSVHNSAWKRLVYKYSIESLYRIATDLLKLPETSEDQDTGAQTHPASDWVTSQIALINEYLSNLKVDDNISADSSDGGGVGSIEGSDLSGVDTAIANFRLEVIQALGETPTMMGVEGASFNFGSVAWAVQAQSLEDIRDDVLTLLKRIGDLHFRLLGSTLKTEIAATPIRTTDALVDSQARGNEISNEFKLVAAGFTSPETASVKLTGSGVADDAVATVENITKLVKGTQTTAPADAGDNLPAGSTAEEKKASGAQG